MNRLIRPQEVFGLKVALKFDFDFSSFTKVSAWLLMPWCFFFCVIMCVKGRAGQKGLIYPSSKLTYSLLTFIYCLLLCIPGLERTN